MTTKTIAALTVALTLSVCGTTASPAAADLAAGSFVLDGSVNAIAHDSSDATTYVGGSFTQALPQTGSGLIVPTTGTGTPDTGAFAHVAGHIVAVVADGSGGWYIGGTFTTVGTAARSNLAHIKADGAVDSTWNPSPNGYVTTLAVSGSTLYVGGWFTAIGGQPRNRLAALDTSTGHATSWNPAPNGDLNALTVSGSTVYVAGTFSAIGGQTGRQGIAAVSAATGNATSWNPTPNGAINALAVSGSTIYAGGSFTSIGGQARARLAALDASTGSASAWNPNPDGGFPNRVLSLAVSGSTVYVGGSFASIGGQSRNGLAAVDITSGSATSWNPNPSGGFFGGEMASVSVNGSTVYVGGSFTSVGGQARSGVAALDAGSGIATTWNPRPGGPVQVVAATGSTVYVGGRFAGAGPALAPVSYLARISVDGRLQTDWHPDPDGPVSALAVSGSTLYAAGNFGTIGGQSRTGLAALSTATGAASSWSPNPNDAVSVLAVSGSTVYAGGRFTTIGGQTRNRLAAIDAGTGAATTWNPNVNLVSGSGAFPTGTSVTELVLSGSTVYAGGYFETIGGQSRMGIAALDVDSGLATSWNPNANINLDSGLGIEALAVSGSTVYVAGAFTTIGGQSRDHLAALDANSGAAKAWNPELDATGSAPVSLLVVSGSTVFASGFFDSIGGQSRLGLAGLDAATGNATDWDPQPDFYVNALTVSGTTAHVGGAFSSVGRRVTGSYAQLDTVPSTPDDTAPTITIATPTDGQQLTQGQLVPSTFSCTDGAGSGVASCTGPSSVDTSTVGNHDFTVSASDHAGNDATKTVHYSVVGPSPAPPATTTSPSDLPATPPPSTTEPAPPSPITPPRQPSVKQPVITAPKSVAQKKLKNGIKISVAQVKARSSVTVKILLKRKTVASVKTTATAQGTARLTVKLPKAALRKIKRKSELTVQVGVTRPDGKTASLTGKMRVS